MRYLLIDNCNVCPHSRDALTLLDELGRAKEVVNMCTLTNTLVRKIDDIPANCPLPEADYIKKREEEQ